MGMVILISMGFAVLVSFVGFILGLIPLLVITIKKKNKTSVKPWHHLIGFIAGIVVSLVLLLKSYMTMFTKAFDGLASQTNGAIDFYNFAFYGFYFSIISTVIYFIYLGLVSAIRYD